MEITGGSIAVQRAHAGDRTAVLVRPLTGNTGLGEQLVAVLSAAVAQAARPVGPRMRPEADVYLGQPFVAVKCLRGLPSISDARVLAGIVRAGSSRYFLCSDGRAPRVSVWRSSAGNVWAAAYDTTLLDALRQSAEQAGVRLKTVRPQEGVGVRNAGAGNSERAAAVQRLALCGDDIDHEVSRPGRWSVTRALAVGAVAALIVGQLAPPIALSIHNHQREASLGQHSASTAASDSMRTEVEQLRAELAWAGAYANDRHSVTAFIGDIASRLPTGVAVRELSVQGHEASIRLYGHDVASAVVALHGAPSTRHIALASPITREPVDIPDADGYAQGEDDLVTMAKTAVTVRVLLRSVAYRTEAVTGHTRMPGLNR